MSTRPPPTGHGPREPDAWIGAIQAAVAEVRADPGVAGLRAALHHLEDVPEIATLCAGVHQVLGEILPARNFSVCLREETAPNLQFVYHVDEREAAPEDGPCPGSLVQHVIATNQSLLATAEAFNRLVAGGAVAPIEVPLGAWLGVPLRDGETAIGALVVKTYPSSPGIGPREQELLEVAARHLGRAIARRHAALALLESEARFRALAENAPCAIFILQGTQLRFANEAACEITGYTIEDFETRTLWDVIHPEDRDKVRRHGRDMGGSSTPVRREVRLVRKDGQPRWVDFSAQPLRYRGRPAVMGVGLDVTARKVADARIEALAYNDALTGLPNRRLLLDRLGVALAHAHRQGKRLGVMFLDLDDFKDVNDSLGHQAGDDLLQAIAARLAGAMRAEDTVARIGGDEFVLLLTQVSDATQAAAVGQQVLGLLRAPVMVAGRELFMNGSMGISIYPEDGHDADTLLKNADAALYRAKEQGRDNCQLYTLSLHTAAMARLEMESGLHRALERGELFLEYQPAWDLTRNRVHGVEALMRWRHPVHGVLPPADFLPLAESSSLILPMGWWALATACRQVKAWQELGHPDLTVAVNIAARQFHDPSLLRRVTQVLAETGLRPACLELEITESQAMKNPEATSRVLAELNALGVLISIDDFGTGYSSLSYLRQLPIHTLKVDKSFVRGIDTGPGDAAIAIAIIRLAHTLNLSVQAEGVETREELEVLGQEACDRIQGYFYSRPLGDAACEAFLKQPPTGLALPAAARSEPLAAIATAPPVFFERRCIVVIEDSDETREAIETILSGAGYRVAATGDPRQAVALVREHQPDLVLCDITMPGMDGYAVVRALQAEDDTARFPVVFLTANHELAARTRAFRFGVVDYLTKPISQHQLQEQVARILSTLAGRKGAVEERGAAAAQLAADVQRLGRTGLLTVRGDAEQARIVLRAGTVVGQAGDVAAPTRARFEELDPRREQIVAGEPDPQLDRRAPPTFDDIPRGLREVLIAEHDPLFRGHLRSVLEARGFRVQDASSGEEALRLALQRPPQIVLLDVRPAGLDGFEICRRLRAHRATRDVPVVFLSHGRVHDAGAAGAAADEGPPPSIDAAVDEILTRMHALMEPCALAGAAAAGDTGMQGTIELMGAPGLLQMCHQGGLSGALEVTRAGRSTRMTFEAGRLARASSDEHDGRDAVIEFAAWPDGRFSFEPGASTGGGAIDEPTDLLILDACRILDERTATRLGGRAG
ncbi:MAG: EAL domain-containing protein [Vicinamibacteria bacterium]|nr:EAL domain-containing protein [Vicinamibacteria bacterium]